MDGPTWHSVVTRLLALCIPLGFALAAPFVAAARPFRRASQAAHGALAVALGVAVGSFTPVGAGRAPAALGRVLERIVLVDAVTAVMLVLVTFIAVVIVRYSRRYLHGDPGQRRYARALLATLGAVTTLIVTNDLLVLAIAWIAASFALHQLLTFYPDRRPALVAAHKKFLLSRLADACLLGAVVLVRFTVGSLDLGVVNAWAQGSEAMPPTLQGAALLLVVCVSLKSAQLPFHGWLIQVMEAPTPVSALLHAGVVNIGGFVMIRLAPFVARVPLAQTLLVVVGTVTAVVAALVMMTRVSVKVALAWSTCAQMGFMLVECGLGAWHLALLHLVAHSLYKAHAFLGAGAAVDAWRVQSLLGPRPHPSAGVVVGFLIRVAALVVLYLAGHALAGRVVRLPETIASPAAWGVVIVGFASLVVVQFVFARWPHGRLARYLQPRLFAGLYLDELFTRLTFRLWPPRLPAKAPLARAQREILEARA